MPIRPRAHERVFDKQGNASAAVSVFISLYNYEKYIAEALESVFEQTIDPLDLIVVDDASKDASLERARIWMVERQARFNRLRLLRHRNNSGLPSARNTGIWASETPYVFILDADNVLFPRCLARCLQALESSGAAFAYPMIEIFGGRTGLLGYPLWNPERLAAGNYIDAMALIRRDALVAVGGYSREMKWGWEDYDLWCTFAERGWSGTRVPEVLARYRVHTTSMLQQQTNRSKYLSRVIHSVRRRHPWVLAD